MTVDPIERLQQIRASIDNVDGALVHLLAERFTLTKEVGVLKADHGMPASDPVREARQAERLRTLSERSGLDPAFSEAFLRIILDEVVRHHEGIAAPQRRHEV